MKTEFLNVIRRTFLLLVLLGVALTTGAADKKPLKVFLLVGQSNMQGHAHVRTLEHLGMNADTKPWLADIQDPSGKPRVHENVWISYLTNGGERHGQLTTGYGANEDKIGPELMFGIEMQKKLKEPFLIIKAAWGGKSLNTDFRPPSAGPYVFNNQQLEQLQKRGKNIDEIKAEKVKATGVYYREMLTYVKKVLADISQVYPDYDAKQGYELAGFVWFQGWNDMVDSGTYPRRDQPGGYAAYSGVMADFIRDVRRDLSAPKLPFVIGVLGVNGPTDKYGKREQRYRGVHQNFRDAMAAPASLPEFQGTVQAVLTEKYWDSQLDDLVARDQDVSQQFRKLRASGELSRDDEKRALEKLWAEEFSKQELELLRKGVSNGGYHYLGSARILSGIGKGFAEAMIQLNDF